MSVRSAAASVAHRRAPTTRRRIGSANSLPITAAVCSTCFSRSARRSMRAASTACTVAGSASVGRPVARAGRRRVAHEDSPSRRAPARPPRRRTDCRRCARGSTAREPGQRRVGAEQIARAAPSIGLGAERQQRELLVVRASASTRRGTRAGSSAASSVRVPAAASTSASTNRSLAASIQWRSSSRITAGSRRLRACDDAPHDRRRAARWRASGSMRGRGPLGIGDAEEVEEERQALAQRLVEQQQPPGDLLARRLRRCPAR